QQPGTGRKARRQRRRQRQAAAAAGSNQAQNQASSHLEVDQDDDLNDEAVMNTLTNAFGGVYTSPQEEAEHAARKKLDAAKKALPTRPVEDDDDEEKDNEDEEEEDEEDEEDEDEDEDEEEDENLWEQAAEALNEPQETKQQHQSQKHHPQETDESEQDEEMEQEPQQQEEDETMEDIQEELIEDEEEPQPDPELVRKSQVELQEIRTDLDNLAHELQQIVSGVIPNKKRVLLTEENLTKAMLRIDSVESGGDESIRKQRKELIGRAEQILEKVDEFKRRTKISVQHR
ncbi:hypothetical protein BGW39_009566, partial [Mortierella sp. 14UC]